VAAAKVSAGLLMYRRGEHGLEVLLAHPGGPFFARKDDGAWTIPKGVPEEGEELRAAAAREFGEETGLPVSEPLLALGDIKQKGGKTVHAWAFAGDALPPAFLPRSNTFEMEWPPRSGRRQSFPEIDRAELFGLDVARRKINPAQIPFLDRLLELLAR
jgi:predicted NUDIX family NTP pyrophosphohydrolase